MRNIGSKQWMHTMQGRPIQYVQYIGLHPSSWTLGFATIGFHPPLKLVIGCCISQEKSRYKKYIFKGKGVVWGVGKMVNFHLSFFCKSLTWKRQRSIRGCPFGCFLKYEFRKPNWWGWSGSRSGQSWRICSTSESRVVVFYPLSSSIQTLRITWDFGWHDMLVTKNVTCNQK